MYTLTSRDPIPDEEFQRRLDSWLAWGRKYAAPWFRYYAATLDLQQRGVLHAHVLLFRRMPRKLWERLRALWVDTYDMGPGSFDVSTVRRASRAAAYLARYVAQERAEGTGRRVGRNGRPYSRETFSGNAYRVSSALRSFSLPVTEFHLPWGTGAALDAVNLRGMVAWFDSPAQAHSWLAASLERPRAGPHRA